MTKAELAKRFRAARLKADKTQDDVASAMGIQRSSVSWIEQGHRDISALELWQFAQYVNCPIEDFFLPCQEPIMTTNQIQRDPLSREVLENRLRGLIITITEFYTDCTRHSLADQENIEDLCQWAREILEISVKRSDDLGIVRLSQPEG